MRSIIGSLFAILGGLLLTYGVTSDPAIYSKSLGINLNVIWGGVMLAFGLLALISSFRRGRHDAAGD